MSSPSNRDVETPFIPNGIENSGTKIIYKRVHNDITLVTIRTDCTVSKLTTTIDKIKPNDMSAVSKLDFFFVHFDKKFPRFQRMFFEKGTVCDLGNVAIKYDIVIELDQYDINQIKNGLYDEIKKYVESVKHAKDGNEQVDQNDQYEAPNVESDDDHKDAHDDQNEQGVIKGDKSVESGFELCGTEYYNIIYKRTGESINICVISTNGTIYQCMGNIRDILTNSLFSPQIDSILFRGHIRNIDNEFQAMDESECSNYGILKRFLRALIHNNRMELHIPSALGNPIKFPYIINNPYHHNLEQIRHGLSNEFKLYQKINRFRTSIIWAFVFICLLASFIVYMHIHRVICLLPLVCAGLGVVDLIPRTSVNIIEIH